MRNNECNFHRYDRLIIYVLLAMIVVIPITINMHSSSVISPLITERELLGTNVFIDTFSYYKFVLLAIGTLIILAIFVVKCIKGYRVKWNSLTYMLMAFVVVILVSTLLSDNTTTAFWGYYNRMEGAVSYIAYIIILIVAMNIRYPANFARLVAIALIPFVMVNTVIVTLVICGVNIMDLPRVDKLITLTVQDEFIYTERSLLMGTLNQWNNTSGMAAALIGFYVWMSFVEQSKKWIITFWVMALLLFVVLVANISTFGFACAMLALVAVGCYWLWKKQWHYVLGLLTYIIVAFGLTFVISLSNAPLWENDIGDRIWNESFGSVLWTREYALPEKDFPSKQHSLEVELTEIQYTLPILPDRGNAALSSRMYIWEKSLQLVKERPLFGYGVDTLVYYFPHYNIDARAGISTEALIVDKPHSVYIGIVYGTGIIGTLLVIAIAITMLVVIYQHLKSKYFHIIKWPFVIMIVIYAMQALLYDSVVGSSIIICIALGWCLAPEEHIEA